MEYYNDMPAGGPQRIEEVYEERNPAEMLRAMAALKPNPLELARALVKLRGNEELEYLGPALLELSRGISITQEKVAEALGDYVRTLPQHVREGQDAYRNALWITKFVRGPRNVEKKAAEMALNDVAALTNIMVGSISAVSREFQTATSDLLRLCLFLLIQSKTNAPGSLENQLLRDLAQGLQADNQLGAVREALRRNLEQGMR